MQRHLAMLRAHQVVDDVGTGSSTAGIAKPFFADVAHDDGRGIADSAVAATPSGQMTLRCDVIFVLFLSELKIVDACSDGADFPATRNRRRFQLVEAIELKNIKKWPIKRLFVTDKEGERENLVAGEKRGGEKRCVISLFSELDPMAK